MFGIAHNVALEFGTPIAGVGFGRTGVEAVFFGMHVPETSVHEDDLAAGAKHEVGFSGKVAPVQAIAVAESVDHAADDEFGSGVRGSDRRHVGRAAQFGDFVCQISDLVQANCDKLVALKFDAATLRFLRIVDAR